jgi:purine nucleoside permease
MSYGVWRKRGKGWSSIEIDSPWNYTFYDLESYDENKAKRLRAKTESFYSDNPHYAQWSYGQESKGRTIEHIDSGGEHSISIAYNNENARRLALEKFKNYGLMFDK